MGQMRNFLRCSVLMMAFLRPMVGFSGEDHAHDKGPHGGVVKGFGNDNHLEAVKSGDHIVFYVLNGEATSKASISKHGEGKITVVVPGKNPEKTVIPAAGSFSEIQAPVSGKGKITAIVTLKVDGKTVSAKFQFAD